MKRFYGTYVGICIQNNDPEFRGRIKVWVPHVSATVFENWNQDRKDKKFKFVGGNLNSPINPQLLDNLKSVLPWAEYVAPSIGSSGSGVYNSNKDVGTISDSNISDNRTPISNPSFSRYKFNTDNVGEKSGKVFETKAGRVNDAFTTTSNNVNQVNVNAYNYKPSTYSNSAKGSFSIPNVGAHVTVFFMEGNPMHPYYFGVVFGQDDFASIFNPSQKEYEDYPAGYENTTGKTGDDAATYRNKYVFSQKGGTIEIVNTDKRESLKLTHYSGSFKEYNNNTGVEFLATNNQKLVLGDEYDTVRGYRGIYTGRDLDLIVQGDSYRKVGNLAQDLVNQWVGVMQEIADAKGLFEIKRAPFVSSRYSSPSQVRTGSFANCPTCGGSGTVLGDSCGTCAGIGQSPSSQNGTWLTDPNKANIITLIQNKATQLAEIERKMGRGGSDLVHITKHKIESIGLVLNKFNAIRVDPVGTLDFYAVTVAENGVYNQQKAFSIFEKVHVDDLPGGTFTHFIGNKYDAIVGAGGYRVKTYGNLDLAGAITSLIGDQVIIGSANEVTIDGGKRVNLIADSISFKSRLGKQVAVQGNFGVSNNVVIGGGLHVEGELNVQHVTAPLEFQVTEPVHIKTTFTIRGMNTTGILQPDGTNQNITGGDMTGEIELDIDHTHYFRNLPLTLVTDNSKVRDDSKSAINTDSTTPRTFKPVENGRKCSDTPTMEGPNNGPTPHS